MKVAVLSPISWRTPPRKYGPWEQVASTIAEGLVQKGHEVTLFATGDSITRGKLESVCDKPYSENREIDPKVWECIHISHLMEQAKDFDIIHNHFDFLPLTYSRLIQTPMITTIHGFSSAQIIPVYQKYNASSTYISISDSDRHPDLDYYKTIYHGVDPLRFTYQHEKDDYLLYFGRIHPEKGAHVAIEIAKKSGYRLKIAGLIQDEAYFAERIKPHIDDETIEYIGNVGPEVRDKLLGHAKALLHPIFFEEPFGLSVLEAMMCGTPVIAFSRGSMPELVSDGKSGFLVNDVAEATAAVGRLSTLNPRICRLHACNVFSVDAMISAYIKAYENTVATFS
jgi:glycosyltransferase involved in cell wall biosynthesis